jgi:glycine/D-amino acid oxidase-like deaminating enzyme
MVDDSIPFAKKHEMEYERISTNDLLKRYPVVNSQGIDHAYLDPFGGYLLASVSCRLVKETFINEGGTYISSFAKPNSIHHNKISSVWLTDNTELYGDLFIFACGAWLGDLFPEVLKDIIVPSKQEVYYFGVPEDKRSLYKDLPVWVDVDGKDFYYGIPSNDGCVFKIGVDKRGETIHPDRNDRLMNQVVFNEAKKFISHRFPDLHNAPLIDSRVCAYENSPDGNFIFDHHPEADNVIILGGGSGHGFKHGPAIGELVSEALSEGRMIPGLFSLDRFK